MLLLTKCLSGWSAAALVAVFVLAAAGDAAKAQGRRTQCSDYARTAVAQFDESQKLRCAFDGQRWHDRREAHFAWCLISPQGTAEENHVRRQMLMECAERHGGNGGHRGAVNRDTEPDPTPAQRHAACDTYAKVASVQSSAAMQYGCPFRGSEWSRDHRTHYQWCMHNRRERVIEQIRLRAEDLQGCFYRLGG